MLVLIYKNNLDHLLIYALKKIQDNSSASDAITCAGFAPS